MKDYDIRECSNEEADFVIDKLVEYNLSKVASTQEIDFLNIDRVVEDVKGNIIAGSDFFISQVVLPNKITFV